MNFNDQTPYCISFFVLLFIILDGTIAQSNHSAFEKGLQAITEYSLKAQTEFISSDWFAGRETATPGAFMAADYIASQFKQNGLSPYYPSNGNGFDGYFQKVKLISSETISSKITVTKLENHSRVSQTFFDKVDLDLTPFSKDLSLEGDIFFGNYALSQSLFEQIKGSSKGLILIRIAGLPCSDDSTSLLYQSFAKMTNIQLQTKKDQLAKDAGFVAILEYDPANPSPIEIKHPNLDRTPSEKILHKKSSGIYRKQVNLVNNTNDMIPVFKISENVISAICPKWKESLNNIKMTNKKPEKGICVNIEIKTNSQLIECRNVLAIIEGENKDQVIIAGAHYDHLGEYDGYIWNGADDNASGTIGILALAKAFAASGIKPKKTLVFATWTAEERGLHGSTFFVQSHTNPDIIKYYLNYDMIGREADPKTPDMNVSFMYTKTWEDAAALIRSANEDLNLNLNIRYSPSESLTGGSDQAPFAQIKVPVMWFHTGGHSDYHGPFDHADKINYKKLSSIVKASFSALWKLANE